MVTAILKENVANKNKRY